MNSNISNIIEFVKNNPNSEISEIEKQLYKKFKISDIPTKDLHFLINLIINNSTLHTDTILEIFFNFQKKINHKIVVKKDDVVLTSNINNTYNNIFLDIFADYGYLFIKPQQIIVLWNEKNNSKSFGIKNYTSIFKSKDYEKNNDTEIIIQYINYDIFNSSNIKITEKEKKFDYYMRKFGLKQYKFGFQTNFQLMVALDIEKVFLSVTDIYKGKIDIYFNNKKKDFIIKEKSDLENIIQYFKNDLIYIFRQNIQDLLKYLYLFLEDNILQNYLEIIFKTFELNIKFIKRKEINKYVYISQEKKFYDLQITKPCLHEELLINVDYNNDFFKNINNFIKEYVYFSESMAICRICSENLPSLYIKENIYLDADKYIVNINNDILFYDPYNKFSNVKIYFENIFYLFNYYTKLNFSIDSNFIIRLCLDTFINLNSERLSLETKYKNDINENNIFFLRISTNFFESDNEKEKYKDKKTIFSYYIIFIIIIITLSIHDFDDMIFFRKQININKLNKNIQEAVFEDIIVLFIDFLFKKFNIDYYEDNSKVRLARIHRTVEIYYEIFNDEIQYIYMNKKIGVENFLKKKTQYILSLEIPFINSTFEYIVLRDFYDTNKQINTLVSIYDTTNNKNLANYIKIYNYYNDKTNTLFIDFNSFDINNFSDKKLLNNLMAEFENINQYEFLNSFYSIKYINDDTYILYNENNILLKNTNEIRKLTTVNNTKELDFFVYNDTYIFKKNINYYEFIEILFVYIDFIEKYFNITIVSNMINFFKTNYDKITFSRFILFFYKLEIINVYKKFVKDKINIYENFNKDVYEKSLSNLNYL